MNMVCALARKARFESVMRTLRRLRSVVNRPQTDLRSVRLREVDEPRSPGI